MPYVGKTPTIGNFVKLDAITTSATTTFNLTNGGVAYSPQSANHCLVSLNGVIQSPGTSFTISGSTIVFASALTSSDVIDFILVLGDVLNIGTPSDATVTTSKLATDLTVTHALASATTPSITFTGDTNTGIFSPTADTIGLTTGGTERVRVDSSGQVGIGTSSPVLTAANRGNVTINGSAGSVLNLTYGGSATALFYADNTLGKVGTYTSIPFLFITGDTERMRIESSGRIQLGKTASNIATNGISFYPSGELEHTANQNIPYYINRTGNDGTLISLMQDGTTEGTISVSGVTVSYNGFTGSHWSRFIDESKPDVLRGTVLESLDKMTDWYYVEFETSYTEKDKDGNDVVKTTTQKETYALKANEQEGDVITYAWNTGKKDEDDNDIIEQVQATIVKEVDVKHVMSKISDTVEAKNVYGVFHAWDNDDLINNDFYVASVGSYVVRIKAGQIVSKGDLLQSNGDGTAKVQADDIIRASTFAKVLSNTVIETYEDGSFIVPCSLMC